MYSENLILVSDWITKLASLVIKSEPVQKGCVFLLLIWSLSLIQVLINFQKGSRYIFVKERTLMKDLVQRVDWLSIDWVWFMKIFVIWSVQKKSFVTLALKVCFVLKINSHPFWFVEYHHLFQMIYDIGRSDESIGPITRWELWMV